MYALHIGRYCRVTVSVNCVEGKCHSYQTWSSIVYLRVYLRISISVSDCHQSTVRAQEDGRGKILLSISTFNAIPEPSDVSISGDPQLFCPYFSHHYSHHFPS